MKLATISSENNKRDGKLVVVSKDNQNAVAVEPETTLLAALQNWTAIRPELERLSGQVNQGTAPNSFKFDSSNCLAPLPNAPGFYDGSAFLSHVVRARKSRGDTMPESAKVTPLMYQGVSDNLLPSQVPIELQDPAFGGDFEGEFAVITTEVPKGTPAEKMDNHIALFCLFNDVTFREVLKTEIQTKFGFLQSKPNSSFAPIVVTPDELADVWKDGRLNLEVTVKLNGKQFGKVHGGEMHFSFQQLVAHACRTRPLSAGNIIGSGTVSNEDKERGFACLTEARYQEMIDDGKPSTIWLQPNDELEIDTVHNNVSVFGVIRQKVVV